MKTKIMTTTVTIAVTPDQQGNETSDMGGYNSMIEWLHEGQVYDSYTVLEVSDPIEYKLVKKGK